MKLYIAGPMKDLPDSNYPAFNMAAAHLRDAGFEILNPVEVPVCPFHHQQDDEVWSWYIRRTLAQVLEADAIALLEYPSTQRCFNSKGALLELTIAQALKMQVMFVHEWLGYELDYEAP